MIKMDFRMMITTVREFLMIRKKYTGKKTLIIKIILTIKILEITNKVKFKFKRMLILKLEKEESKKRNREKLKDGIFLN